MKKRIGSYLALLLTALLLFTNITVAFADDDIDLVNTENCAEEILETATFADEANDSANTENVTEEITETEVFAGEANDPANTENVTEEITETETFTGEGNFADTENIAEEISEITAFAEDDDSSNIYPFVTVIQFQDGDNIENKRPESIEVKILDATEGYVHKTVKVKASENWHCEVKVKYDPQPWVYKFELKDSVPGYEATKFEYFGSYNYITMTLVSDLSGTVVWNDADNKDNLRPADLSKVEIALNVNGREKSKAYLNSDGSYNFGSCPVYDEDGNKNVYTVSLTDSGRNALPGYEARLNSDNQIELVRTTDIKTYISWTDGNNAPDERPDKVTAVLYDMGDKSTYSVDLTKENNWTASCSVPKYEKSGSLKDYNLYNVEIEGYTQGAIVIGDNEIMVQETYTADMPVKVIWNDGDNAENTRPESLTVNLYKNKTEKKGSIELNSDNNWTNTFGVLPLYDESGEILYIHEQEELEDYIQTSAYLQSDGTFVFVNTLAEDIDVSVEWNDGSSADRPEEVTVHVLQNKEAYRTITVTADDGWKSTLSDCPKYDENGSEYSYTFAEEVDGYIAAIDGNTITNTLEIPEITAQVNWNDGDNAGKNRPGELMVSLCEGDTLLEQKKVSEDTNWKCVFESYPKYDENGKQIEYNISTGDADNYLKAEEWTALNKCVITFTETQNITVNNLFNDEDNSDKTRPETITVYLYENGARVLSAEAKAADNYRVVFL